RTHSSWRCPAARAAPSRTLHAFALELVAPPRLAVLRLHPAPLTRQVPRVELLGDDALQAALDNHVEEGGAVVEAVADDRDLRRQREPRSRSYAFRQQLVPPWVKPRLVGQGTDFVVAHFRGEPFLPSEFMGEVAPVWPGALARAR